MKKIRVILDGRVITDHFPGIGNYARNLALALAEEEDLELLVVQSAGGRGDAGHLPSLSSHPRIRMISCPAGPVSLAQHYCLDRLAGKYGADLWHSTWYMAPWLKMSCPTVFTFYDTIPLLLPQYWPAVHRILFRLAHRLAFRSMSGGIVLSQSAKKDLERLAGARGGSLVPIPPGVPSHYAPAAPEAVRQVRNRYRLDRDYMFFVGINKPSKNLTGLLAAYRQHRRSMSEAQPLLVVAGPWDSRYPEARAMAMADDLRDSVRFLGFVPAEEMPALYTGSLFYVCPSLQEGFGFPLAEAMACGTAVACSRAGSLPEVAGEAACYFDPENAAELADVLTKAATDAVWRKASSALGRERAARFSWKNTARRTLEIYREVLDRESAPARRRR